VILVANKVDTNDWIYNIADFYALGLGEPFPVSASNGHGTGDLLDEVVKDLPQDDTEEDTLEKIPRFAIVGRPNAGKSSILNMLLGDNRAIVYSYGYCRHHARFHIHPL
jgi:GTP-binding protein